MRQTWEEIGLDLADFLCIGQLDDREITTSLGKRLLMVLSSFILLQLVPKHLVGFPSETTLQLHWTALANLVARRPHPSTQSCTTRSTGRHDIRRDPTQCRCHVAVWVGKR